MLHCLFKSFWSLNDKNINRAIALDPNRVGINFQEGEWMEFDTWYAPKFSTDIVTIKDDVGHLRTPSNIDQEIVDLLFHKKYSLNIMWSTANIDGKNAKVFQAEEFNNEEVTVEINGTSYHPARYIHAIYKPSKGHFDHFDGAVHLYSNEEYLLRRDADFNYNSKNPVQIKAASEKLFKLTGLIPVNTWMEFTSHFLSQNALVHEYFTGQYDAATQDAVDAVRKSHQ